MIGDTSKYVQLEKELGVYITIMSKAADSILDQEVSKYPIFVAHQHEVEIGISILDEDHISNWRIHASTLEEFVSKQIIEPEKVDSFKTIYKSPQTHSCVFVLSELGAKFIFLPRK